MTTPDRLYVLTRLRSGDYICLANDGETLWRFQRYEDGRDLGLDVGYDAREFWRASYAPRPDHTFNPDEMDELPWREAAQWLSTRREAITVMLKSTKEPT